MANKKKSFAATLKKKTTTNPDAKAGSAPGSSSRYLLVRKGYFQFSNNRKTHLIKTKNS